MDYTTIYQGRFAKVVKLNWYKSPVYKIRLDQSYAPYARALNWKRIPNRVAMKRAYGTPTALIQAIKAWEAKEKAFGKNKGDQLWLDGFHPMDNPSNNPALCSHYGAFHSA